MNLSQLLSREQGLLHAQVKLKAKINSASPEDKNLLVAELAATDRELQAVRADQLKEIKNKLHQD